MIQNPVPCRLLCSTCLATFPAEVMKTVGTGGWLESDLCYQSHGTFPYPYLVAVCPCCHWGAYIRDFDKLAYLPRYGDSEISRALRVHLHEQRILYPGSRKYQLTAVSYSRAGAPPAGVGDLHLRGVWCARQEKNTEAEQAHLEAAVQWFERAVAQHLSGFEQARLHYLLGELNRRLERYEEAVRWFDGLGPGPAWLESWSKQMCTLARERDAAIQIL
ncbi:MAG: DUF2225 domain-containing protein [Candidatus Desulforudis sp.]|nr:DUF2225 domain-containing protein [Desulforudis sp.]